MALGAAIYLAEYARDTWLTRAIRLAIINLAGIPSVVYGLFGLGLFVIFMKFGTSILAASLTLSIMTLPVIISTTEEALRGVPNSFRVVSTSLGASRWQTVRRITLPQAPAPILFTGAVSMGPIPKSIFDPTRTLSYGSYDMAVGDRLAMMVPHNQYGMVVTLILLILVLNALAVVLRSRVFKKLKGH